MDTGGYAGFCYSLDQFDEEKADKIKKGDGRRKTKKTVSVMNVGAGPSFDRLRTVSLSNRVPARASDPELLKIPHQLLIFSLYCLRSTDHIVSPGTDKENGPGYIFCLLGARTTRFSHEVKTPKPEDYTDTLCCEQGQSGQ